MTSKEFVERFGGDAKWRKFVQSDMFACLMNVLETEQPIRQVDPEMVVPDPQVNSAIFNRGVGFEQCHRIIRALAKEPVNAEQPEETYDTQEQL